MEEDEAVRSTNDDASVCKRSAVERGYWRDPYIQYFIRSGERKVPEINRGYYARVQGIRTLLRQFFDRTKGECQVINLGAGFDTIYWNLKDDGIVAKNFVEVDFQAITTRKCYYIRRRKELLEKLSTEGKLQVEGCELHSPTYHLISADLRDSVELQSKLAQCSIDTALPTLFIAECVLVYMPSESSATLLRSLAASFPTALFINYEQVNMRDRFGEVMVENLKQRNCVLAGVDHCISLQTQSDRFTSTGWDSAQAMDMVTVYRMLDQADVQREDGLHLLLQLRQQLFSHHCICWAYNDRLGIGLADVKMRPVSSSSSSSSSTVSGSADHPPVTGHLMAAVTSPSGKLYSADGESVSQPRNNIAVNERAATNGSCERLVDNEQPTDVAG